MLLTAHRPPTSQSTGTMNWSPGLSIVLRTVGGVAFALVFGWVLIHFLRDIAIVGRWAYLGVFLGETANSAAVLIPTPAPLYTATAATLMNPILVGIVGGIGAALGELVGYAIGLKGKGSLEGSRLYTKLYALAGRRSGAVVFVAASLPLLPDIAGLWAGAVRYSLWRFLVLVTAGKVLKVTCFSLVIFAASSR